MLEKSIKELNRVSISLRVRVSISSRASFKVSIRFTATAREAGAVLVTPL